ncbi:MAG: sugar phosphate nucleotidyltransferase [Nitrospirae bacterium]|nr:sugar phosphate nucleotidyltransferase [Nitrospirota bacterium]
MNYRKQNKSRHREIIGLLPAGGKASRVAPLPCSKDLYPVGFHSVGKEGSLRPKVVSHYLLEKLRLANIKKVYIILREGKWDIPTYFGDGKILDMHVAYLMMGLPFGVPYTLDQAYPFIENHLVALGFPDAILQPDDAFVKLLDKQEESNADIVLGLFPAMYPHKNEMVEFDDNGSIRSIQIKSDRTELVYAWEIAIWTPVFTRFMHDYVSARQGIGDKTNDGINQVEQNELHVGDVIQAAIESDLQIDSVLFEDGSCLDIGTPEDLRKAAEYLSVDKEAIG